MPQTAHLNGSPKKCHFPDFPILTSGGGPGDRNSCTLNGALRGLPAPSQSPSRSAMFLSELWAMLP